MMKLTISFALLLGLAAVASAQQTQPSPPPSSTPTPVASSPSTPSARSRSIDLSSRFQQFPLNPVSESDRLSRRVVYLHSYVSPFYRKPSDKEISALKPESHIANRYAAFLSAKDTGIFRLVPDSGCVNNDRVVSVKEECLKYSFPGAGNSYSFRNESYRLRHLADLTYSEGKLKLTGIFMHAIGVELGDVPIESTSLSTDGMKFLVDFSPSTTADDVMLIEDNFALGVTKGVFFYSKAVEPKADTTYAARLVAYRGKVVRSMVGIRYNELDYDKRRDIIVVFRIVEKNDSGLTIVWRKLADVESPRIKMPKETEPDIDEAN